jgi:hypothetical protein
MSNNLQLGDTAQACTYADELSHMAEALDHPWGRAVAARCSALIAAAEGTLVAALDLTDHVVIVHRTLPMPFELGRALLVGGQVRRRARQRRSAREALEEAATIFGELGTPLWTDKARQEMARVRGRSPGVSVER